MKKIVLAIFLCLLLTNISYAGKLVAPEAIKHYNDGVDAYKKGNFFAAQSLFQKSLLLKPNDEHILAMYNNLGATYANVGNLDKAEEIFSEIIKINPKYKRAALNLGLVYDKKGDLLKAMKYWLVLFKIDLDTKKPKDFILLSGSEGAVLVNAGNPNYNKIMLNIEGVNKAKAGDFCAAKASLQEALKIDSGYSTASANLALVYDKTEDELSSLENWLKFFNIKLDDMKPKVFLIEGKIEQ